MKLLELVLLVPFVGAVVCFLLPERLADWARRITAIVAAMGLGLMYALWTKWHALPASSEAFHPDLLLTREWVPSLGISFRLGLDGISLLLVLLTLLLLPILTLCSWETISDRSRYYYGFLLLLQGSMLGVFMALDGFLFYVFWEVMLIPMYFLIGIWGGERRLHAAIKFFLFTMVGSVFLLLALITLYFEAGNSFDVRAWLAIEGLSSSMQFWLFLALFAGFAIKVPMWPLHTWLPAAHGQAPTAGSVVLAGVLLKMGTYGFVRFALPILPEAALDAMPWLLALCVIGIIYGSLTAMAQKDMKQLVAYSSVAHLGMVMLGVFCLNPNGLSGGLLQMLNHGLSTGALFLMVGMLYERRHTKLIADYGGIAKVMPLFTTCFFIVTLSSIGLPGLNGFVGEITILLGVTELMHDATGAFRPAGLLLLFMAGTGVVLGAAYMLSLFKRVFWGPLENPENETLKDITPKSLEFFSLAPLIVLCFWIGLYPKPLFDILDPPVRRIVETVRPGYFDHPAAADVLPIAELGGPAPAHGQAAPGQGGGDSH